MPDGTYSILGKPVKKNTVLIAGGLSVLVIGYALYNRRKAAGSSSASGLVTDPAGSQCSVLDPNSGYCPGTAADIAYQQQAGSNLAGFGGGGSSAGTGGYAYPVTPGAGIAVPGSVVPTFTDNGSWFQYAEAYMVQNLGGDATTIGNALGRYLNGTQVTGDQQQIIENAIAIAQKPPVAGPDGFPPSIRLAAATTPPPVTGTTLPAPAGFSVTPHAHLANFGWGAVPHATGYDLEVDGSHEHTMTTTHFSLPLPAGRHTARVRAAGGAWTAVKTFTVPSK